MTFKFRMTVLVEEDWTYEVEADSECEAREKAGIGDTTFEVRNGVFGVREREITAMEE